MNKQGAYLVYAGVAWCSALGCDQELAFPTDRGGEAAGAGAPSSGITGAGGADDGSAEPDRLQLPDGPLHGPLGGAGGEAAQGGEGASSDAPIRGGASPSGTSGSPQGSGVGGVGGMGNEPAEKPRVLFFSEYLEGTGSLKALEIYSEHSASLEGCELQTFYNGKLEPARLALHERLEAGGVQVLCSSALALAQPDLCDRSTNLTFNGDDAIALVCAGTTFDVFGRVGEDPGQAWAGSTMDHTLRRRCDVTTGRSDGSTPFDPSAEWTELGSDVFDDLGRHDCSEPSNAGGAGGAAGASASP
jgi:hypothetical protein